MILVNVLERFQAIPRIFKHLNTELCLADPVAPLFIFIVGMGFQLAYTRMLKERGALTASLASLKRYCILFVVAVFVYHFSMRRIFWDALTEISVAGILALPFIGRPQTIRIGAMIFYPTLLAIFPNFQLAGKVFEPFLWVVPLLLGTFVADAINTNDSKKIVSTCAWWGAGLFAIGLTFTQFFHLGNGATEWGYKVLYLGLGFWIYLCLHYLADVRRTPLPHMTVLGRNALVIYALHYYIDSDMRKLIERDAPLTTAVFSFLVVYFACLTIATYLNHKKYYVTI